MDTQQNKTYESVVDGVDERLWREGERLLGQRRRQRPHQRTRLIVQLKAVAVDFSMSTSSHPNYSRTQRTRCTKIHARLCNIEARKLFTHWKQGDGATW